MLNVEMLNKCFSVKKICSCTNCPSPIPVLQVYITSARTEDVKSTSSILGLIYNQSTTIYTKCKHL